MKARIVVFQDGRRLEKRYEDHHDAAIVAKKLRRKGLKFALILTKVVASRKYPPDDDDLTSRAAGMLWCPYCGAWRWFKVPQYHTRSEVPLIKNHTWLNGYSKLEENWFLNGSYRIGLKHCGWCRVSEDDFGVRIANNTFGEGTKRRRRRKRRG